MCIRDRYLYGSLSRKLQDTPESHKGGTSDPVYKAAIKREKLLDYVNEFDTKIKFLKSSLTDVLGSLRILISKLINCPFPFMEAVPVPKTVPNISGFCF